MKTCYIYIDPSTAAKLFKLSKQKKLSVSTIVNIIKNHYEFAVARYGNTYQKKGSKKLHLKLKEEHHYPEISLDCLTTNCIYEWETKPNPEKFNYAKADANIQSEMDKTEDPFYDYNQQIRKTARLVRENKKYLERLLKSAK